MFWIFYIVILLLVLKNICSKDKRLLKLSEQLKSKTPCLPILGHALRCYGNTEDLMEVLNHFGKEAIRNGGLTCIWLGTLLYVVCADAVDAEFILRNYLEKGYAMKTLKEVTGNGSVFATVSIWHRRRKILVPTFKPNNIKRFAHIFAKQSKIMVERMKPKALTGESFSIWDYISAYTFDSIGESTLGVALKTQENPENSFLKALEKGLMLIASRMNRPWQYNDIIYKLFPSYYSLQEAKKYVYDFCSKIISKKRQELAEKSSKDTKIDQKETSKSFLELLIKSSGDEKGYSDLELQEEILVLITAGNDTSATGACFTTLMLSRHSDVQQKAYEELKDVLENSNGILLPKDVSKLKYLEAVIKETLRLYPPAPRIARLADRDLTLPSGVTIVKGCDIIVDIWALHRNPRYWGPDAEEFRPERWIEMDLKNQAQYMAFSHGPRNCVGYQYAMNSMTTAIATMLSHYRILPESSPNKDGMFEPLHLKYEIMLKDINNFNVRLENRN